MTKFNTILLLAMIFFSSCEKRIELDQPYPYEEQLFCELIGIPEYRFQGVLSLTKTVEDNTFEPINAQITVFENEIEVLSTEIFNTHFIIPYDVKRSAFYSIRIEYKDQVITSSHETTPPSVNYQNFSAENNYVDSLGFDVVSFNYETVSSNTSDSVYYIHREVLEYFPNLDITFNIPELPKLLINGKTDAVSKRLVNKEGKPFIISVLTSLTPEAYQYFKQSTLLGSIPNDNIDGHQGNLQGAIGYFGIVDYSYIISDF